FRPPAGRRAAFPAPLECSKPAGPRSATQSLDSTADAAIGWWALSAADGNDQPVAGVVAPVPLAASAGVAIAPSEADADRLHPVWGCAPAGNRAILAVTDHRQLIRLAVHDD